MDFIYNTDRYRPTYALYKITYFDIVAEKKKIEMIRR